LFDENTTITRSIRLPHNRHFDQLVDNRTLFLL
jgi:hypothetical protein